MTHFANLNKLAREICQRERSEGREVNMSEVKAVIRHLSDLIAEEWRANFTLKITTALREAAQRRYRRKYKGKDFFRYGHHWKK